MGPSQQVYCVCRQSYDGDSFMIECDACKEWFHGKCVNITEAQARELDIYYCLSCQRIHGTPPRKGFKDIKPVLKAGTAKFIKMLKAKNFLSSSQILRHLEGYELTLTHFETHGFNNPIFVERKEGLRLNLPPSNFSVADMTKFVDPEKILDVIDVCRQQEIKMPLKDWIDYYNSPHREDIYNVISLEVTDSPLGGMIEVPDVVKKLSWVEQLWPMVSSPASEPHHCDKSSTPNRYTNRSINYYYGGDPTLARLASHPRAKDSYREDDSPEEGVDRLTPPCVEKYCLMSVKDSYTDFHVDFGGSSVWYHLLKGEKIFYLIPPTKANLELYEKWSMLHNQTEVFFGDMVDKVYKCVIKQGQTLFLPSGWIHAVLTPIDSLVFGGNFLHSFNVRLQFEIYDLEVRLQTAPRFMFPNFDIINWYAGQYIAEQLSDYHTNICQPPQCLVVGCYVLFEKLKQWNKNPDHKATLPQDINTPKILRELARALKMLKIFGTLEEKPISYVFGEKVTRQSSRTSIKTEEEIPTTPGEKLGGESSCGEAKPAPDTLPSPTNSPVKKFETPIRIKLKVKRKGPSPSQSQEGIVSTDGNQNSNGLHESFALFSPEYTIDHQAYNYPYEQSMAHTSPVKKLTIPLPKRNTSKDGKIDETLKENYFKGSRYDDGEFVYPSNFEEDDNHKAKTVSKSKPKKDQLPNKLTNEDFDAANRVTGKGAKDSSKRNVHAVKPSYDPVVEEIKRSHDYAKVQNENEGDDVVNAVSPEEASGLAAVKKMKKGLSTPKQRLAKIMKLQKIVRY